jgi:hypothetical protein
MRLDKLSSILGLLLIAAVCLIPMGCGGGSKEFTPEDFKKIEKGAADSKVKELLGDPKESMDLAGAKASFWAVKDNYYSVTIKDGKVIATNGPMTKEQYTLTKAAMEAMSK